jgi:hypothetical protein
VQPTAWRWSTPRAGVEYKKAVATYTAAAQNYNGLVAQISHEIGNVLKLQKSSAALRAQIDATRVSAC